MTNHNEEISFTHDCAIRNIVICSLVLPEDFTKPEEAKKVYLAFNQSKDLLKSDIGIFKGAYFISLKDLTEFWPIEYS